MNRRSVFVASVSLAALALTAGQALGQSAKTVSGTYAPVTVEAFGDNPRGQMVLTADGHYSIVLARTTLPKIAAGSRVKGTPEENKAVVEGSIAHWGKYTIDDGGKAITFHVQGSTFPNWDGTTQKRALKVSGDSLTYTVTAPSTGSGKPNDVTWKRMK